jgi:hypothetical protein
MKLLPRLSSFVLPLPVLFFCAASFAASSPDRTQFGTDIHVQAGEKTADVTCINCSVYVRGQVSGDVTTVHGNIVLESGAEVAGDITAIWGNVRTESSTQIAGDLTAVAGSVHRDPQSTSAGDVTALEGTKWLLAIIVPPIIFLGGIIALIIWLVQRNRAGAPAPVYVQPGGQPSTRI